MGCDIHLFVEIRHRKEKDSYWESPCEGEFSLTDYRMFAILNNVRNDFNYQPLPNRGIPGNLSFTVFDNYYRRVLRKSELEKWKNLEIDDNCTEETEAEEFVKIGHSVLIKVDGQKFISDPTWHSPNWCTLKELEACCEKVYEGYEKTGYLSWLALINYMKTFEMGGQWKSRAVFWFDN